MKVIRMLVIMASVGSLHALEFTEKKVCNHFTTLIGVILCNDQGTVDCVVSYSARTKRYYGTKIDNGYHATWRSEPLTPQIAKGYFSLFKKLESASRQSE